MRKICFIAALLLIACGTTSNTGGTKYDGEIVVRSIAPTRVAVLVDSNADRLVDNGFLLTTDVPMGDVAVRLPAAKLVFTDGYIRIVSGARVYDLQVAGYPDPPAAPRGSNVTTLIGSALVHSRGDSGCTIERAASDAGACYSYGVE